MTIKLNHCFLPSIALMLSAFGSTSEAQPLDDSLHSVETRWAQAAYESAGRLQGKTLRILLNDVRGLHKIHPDSAEAAAWHVIVARTYMEFKGSMSLAREARDALLRAMDATARPNHPEADLARKLEVENLLASVERRL
jgi:hypothetical protein